MSPSSPSTPPSTGIYVPAVIFFDEKDELDVDAIKAHVLRLARGGVTGIIVQGSNGEAQFLSHEERKAVIKLTRETLDADGHTDTILIAGTGALSTRETKKLNVDAKEAGAAFALVLTPSTWPPQMTKEAVLKFHRDVADASPIPVLLYNFPLITAGIDLDSDMVLALAQHPNIVGIKLTCANVGKLHRITSMIPSSEFAVLSGKSDIMLHGLLSGSAGGITALVNIAPKVHVKLLKHFHNGELEEAWKIQRLIGHAEWAGSRLGAISGVKAIISREFQYGSSRVRAPLKPTEISTSATLDKLDDLIQMERKL